MLKLDRSRDVGNITPPWQPEDCDRPAYYEQDGKLFDAHGFQIIPGKDGPKMETETSDAKAVSDALTPYDLLRQADVMPWAAFRKRAREILGDTCPASKADIVVALQGAVQHFEERQKARKPGPKVATGEEKSPGLTWNGLTGQEEAEALTAKPAAPPSKPGEVDLAAWARGQKDYLFAEVRKGIRAKFGTVVTERDDAVNLLVDNGVITQAEARKDVRRAPAR